MLSPVGAASGPSRSGNTSATVRPLARGTHGRPRRAVEAERNIVDEYLAVDLPQVDRRFPAPTEGVEGGHWGVAVDPRSRAKWLRVPAGTQTKGNPWAAATWATTAWEPSPPAIPSESRASVDRGLGELAQVVTGAEHDGLDPSATGFLDQIEPAHLSASRRGVH